jgi:hypothetical protein
MRPPEPAASLLGRLLNFPVSETVVRFPAALRQRTCSRLRLLRHCQDFETGAFVI